MSISITAFEKAILSLESSLNLYDKSQANTPEHTAFRDACIQRFEYSIELSYKCSMKLIGSQTVGPKPAVREMARNDLISDPGLWIDFIDARNKTSHSYDEVVALEVFNVIRAFLPEARALYQKLLSLTK